MKKTGKMMKQILDRIGQAWCRLRHPTHRWPVHGHYECPVCLRRYAVLWANDAARLTPEPARTCRSIAGGWREMSMGAPLPGGTTLAARL
jgi:hypothetical protein